MRELEYKYKLQVIQGKYTFYTSVSTAILFAVYLVYSTILTINIPFLDDYWAVLQFVNDFENKRITYYTTFGHINFTSKLLGVISFYTLGEVNFKLFGIIGNISLLIAIHLITSSFKGYTKLFITLPFLLLLLNGRYHSISITGHLSVQHFTTLLFTVLAFKNVLDDKKIPAILFSVLALLTFGAGMVTVLLTVVSILIKQTTKYYQEKKIRKIVIIILLVIIIMIGGLFFLSQYEFLIVIQLFGNVSSKPKLAFLIGCLVLVTIPVIWFRSRKKITLLTLLIIYAVINILLIYFVRSPESYFGAFNSRYSFYPTLLISILFVEVGVLFISKKWVKYIVVLVAILYSTDRYKKGIYSAQAMNEQKKENIKNYFQHTCCVCGAENMEKYCTTVLKESIEVGTVDVNRIKREYFKPYTKK